MENNLFTTEDGKLVYRGDLKVYGVLDAGLVRTTELITHQKNAGQYFEFSGGNSDPVGHGLIWSGGDYNKQLIFRNNPDRFFSSETIDVASTRHFSINNQYVIDSNSLGPSIVNSNLEQVGTLKNLAVAGKINFADHVFYNPNSQRFSIGTDEANGTLTVYDHVNDVELILDGDEDGRGVFGTYNTRGLKIVTDNQERLSVTANGDITLGTEGRDSTTTRIYGKVGIGVKNPVETLEVNGNIRFANKLFASGGHPPTTGHYQKGDIVWNSDPKPSGYVGWVCIQSGSPGSWKVFGQISY